MTAPPAAPNDRRVRRTRKQLRDALVTLVLERGWDRVAVKDVCAHADVGRSTFYVHFADKEELLLSGFDDLHRALDQERDGSRAFAFAGHLVDHARANTRLFRALLGKRSGQEVQLRFREVVTHLVEAELVAAITDVRTRRWVARYVSGGFVEMLLAALGRTDALDTAELIRLFDRLTRGAIAAATQRD